MGNIKDLFINNETPAGAINSTNKVFTLVHAPLPVASLELTLNGVLQTVDEDYTIDDITITFIDAPLTNSVLKSDYRYTDDLITASQINVVNLSAISADVGNLTAGTITGVLFQTSAVANTGVKMSLGIGGIDVYENALDFYNSSGVLKGVITAGDAIPFQITSQTHLTLASVGPNQGIYIGPGISELGPSNDNEVDLGAASREFKNLYLDGIAQIDGLRIDITPTVEVNTATHYILVDMNGTNYKVLLKSV